MKRLVKIDGNAYECDVSGEGGALRVTVGTSRFLVRVSPRGEMFTVNVDGAEVAVPLNRDDAAAAAAGTPVTMAVGGRNVHLVCSQPPPGASEGAHGHLHGEAGAVVAMMPGTIVRVLKKPGDRVAKGEVLMVLEAMKMENEIRSPVEGTVGEVMAQAGKTVAKGELLAAVHPAGAPHG